MPCSKFNHTSENTLSRFVGRGVVRIRHRCGRTCSAGPGLRVRQNLHDSVRTFIREFSRSLGKAMCTAVWIARIYKMYCFPTQNHCFLARKKAGATATYSHLKWMMWAPRGCRSSIEKIMSAGRYNINCRVLSSPKSFLDPLNYCLWLEMCDLGTQRLSFEQRTNNQC